MLFGRKRKTENTQAQPLVTKIDINDPAFKAMIDEAIEVINDIQKIGRYAWILQRGYRGAIGYWACCSTDRNVARYRIGIIMMDTESLDDPEFKWPRVFSNPDRHDMAVALNEFGQKYRTYYSTEDKVYRYFTLNNATAPFGQEKEIEAIFCKEIEKRCPLATGTSAPTGLIYSKDVDHDW